MDTPEDWHTLSAASHERERNKRLRELETLLLSGDALAAHRKALDAEASHDRKRLKLPDWAPLDAVAQLARISDRPGLENHARHLRILLAAPAMRLSWPRLEKKGTATCVFAWHAASNAARYENGAAGWPAANRGERTARSMEMAKAARNLATMLRGTPLHVERATSFFPDAAAEANASYLWRKAPPEKLKHLSAPRSPQEAMGDALPHDPLFLELLEEFARKADALAKRRPRYGRNDATQHARAFVVDTFVELGNSRALLREIGEACAVLLGVHFTPQQLKEITKSQRKSSQKTQHLFKDDDL